MASNAELYAKVSETIKEALEAKDLIVQGTHMGYRVSCCPEDGAVYIEMIGGGD